LLLLLGQLVFSSRVLSNLSSLTGGVFFILVGVAFFRIFPSLPKGFGGFFFCPLFVGSQVFTNRHTVFKKSLPLLDLVAALLSPPALSS